MMMLKVTAAFILIITNIINFQYAQNSQKFIITKKVISWFL